MTALRPEGLPVPTPDTRRTLRLWLRRIGFTLLGLAGVLLVAALGIVLWLRAITRAALPTLDGEERVPGLSAEVTVRRDEHGIPHIEAASQQDLWLAQGYVTAQDRLWQMDAQRRGANGELAELIGPAMVERDKAQRVLRIRRSAERLYQQLPADEKQRLDAYARGVNLYIQQHASALPPEFRILHYQPRPWIPVDSVSVGLNMAQYLDSHWTTKLSRERVEELLHHDQKLINDLYPVGSWRDHPPTGVKLDLTKPHPMPPPLNIDDDDQDDDRVEAGMNEPRQDLLELERTLRLPVCPDCAMGSNNWVVSGAHTASGKPLLANDMHLWLAVPGIWYTADLRAPGYHTTGVSIPGMPYIVAGHNEHVAWGITALLGDVQDLYIEQLDGKGNFEDQDAQWKPLTVEHEVIKVRGGKDVVIDVQSTSHGPIITPLVKNEKRPIALKWTLYDPQLSMPPIYQLNTAGSAAELDAALSNWAFPTQNVVFADDQGHIGYHAVGKVPVRNGGIVLANVPMPQSSADVLWGYQACTGLCPTYIPYDQLPHVFDPPSGFLATANARVTTPDSPLLITHDWASPYRVERIYKALQGREGLTAADMLATQMDVYSELNQQYAHRFAYAIDHAQKTDERLRQAADLMRVWDGKLTTESTAASVVTQTRAALWKMLLEAKLGKEAELYHWTAAEFAEEEIVMNARPDWLPKEFRSWDELITEAVRRALKTGKAPGDLRKWAYGSWHVIDLAHPLAMYLPGLDRIAGTGEQPLSGDVTTVKQSARAYGPSQRFILDWNNPDGAIELIPMGESGNPLSPYFADQWPLYAQGQSFALPFRAATVQATARHMLRLKP